jgi:hypothetical protein
VNSKQVDNSNLKKRNLEEDMETGELSKRLKTNRGEKSERRRVKEGIDKVVGVSKPV